MMNEKSGCLGLFLRFLGIRPSPTGPEALPFRLRDDFLSPAEISFYHVLVTVVDRRFMVCPKVNLRDIFYVARPNHNLAARNHISGKHVDFLLCESRSMRPRIGIELDDSSHARRDRQSRDAFVDRVFETARLPLLRFPVQHAYVIADVAARLATVLEGPATPPPIPDIPDSVPGPTRLCPKCGIPLVLRRGVRGRDNFFGCANYPKCRTTVAIQPPPRSFEEHKD